jgi:aspartate/methionine/tyrosine aminotransferase
LSSIERRHSVKVEVYELAEYHNLGKGERSVPDAPRVQFEFMKGTPIATRASLVPSSPTIAIADRVTELKRAGGDVIDLSAGRATEPTPAYVVRAATEAMLSGDTHQTQARGKLAFREACAIKLRRDNGIDADPDTEILATLGCKQGLFLALLATLDPGDEVLVEDPGFVSYEPAVRYCGGVPIPVPLSPRDRFRFRAESLRERLTSRTKGIVFCSPQNPTGVVHTDEDLEAVASVAREKELLVYADETYERLTWGERRHRSIATVSGMRERTVTLMGLTKSFCMGGWRVGFALAPPPVLEAMLKAQQHLVTCASSFGQTAGAAAYREDARDEVKALWWGWERRVRRATTTLDALPRVSCPMPEGAFYAWADVRALSESSETLAARLLEEHGVAVVPGSAFGPSGEGYLRITCARDDDELQRGLARLKAALV